MKVLFRAVLLGLCALMLVSAAAAQEMSMSMMEPPYVVVADQVVLNGHVVIAEAAAAGPAFIVIHADNNGAPGPVIGYRAIGTGHTHGVHIAIDPLAATPVLYAMLHEDSGVVGEYEFGRVDGADGPIRDGSGAVVTPAFNVAILNAVDSFVADGVVTIASVTMAEGGWVVIHDNADNGPGPVLGQTLVPAGTTANVAVSISESAEMSLFPMLHVDTGAVGEYEFGTVEGADGPVVIEGTVATTQMMTVPHVRAGEQVVVYGDNSPAAMMDMAPTFTASSVLSAGPGVLVIHTDNNGAPGPVAGYAFVNDGANLNVSVTLDLGPEITPVLWPMLHADTGVVGEYEFGTVEGADLPVSVADAVVTFPVAVAPSMDLEGAALVADMDMNEIAIHSVLIDADGWLVIHADNNGAPGPVLGATRLIAGHNQHIHVALSEDPGARVFPMLHYDTGTAGEYEFGVVEGADGPVIVGGAVVVAPLDL